MLLLPPPEAQDTRPVYHISLAVNCFIPSMYVTTLRRGASEFGKYVAEFECVNLAITLKPELTAFDERIGTSSKANTVTILGKQVGLSSIVRKSGNKSQVCENDQM